MKTIKIKEREINITGINDNDYISLTDIARIKNQKEPKDVVKNWMRLRSTLEYLELWERLNNPNFNRVEFDPPYYQKAGRIRLQCHLQDGLENLMQ